MKNLLIYQSTEFDCGPTTLVNAVRYLFEREEIPPALIKGIWIYANDTFNEQGESGKHGTSKAAVRFLAEWLNGFSKGCCFPLRAEYVEREEADITPESRTIQCLKEGGVALMRCWSEGYGHYVLLTKLLEDGSVGLFDPYDMPLDKVPQPEGLKVIGDRPYEMNRTASLSLMNQHEIIDYAEGSVDLRVNLLLWRTEKKAQ